MAMTSNSKVNAVKKQTADDCIKTCLESLADQVSPHKNCLKSIENINKPVKYFGISISKSSLNVNGLTDFIKTQTKECPLVEHDKVGEDSSSDILEIFPSPSRFYKEICDTSRMKNKSKFLDIAKDRSYDYISGSNLNDIDNKENSFSLFTCQNKILDISNDHDLSDILINMSVQDIEEEREQSPFKNSANKSFLMNEKISIRNSTPKRLQNCKPKVSNVAFDENFIENPLGTVEVITIKDSPEIISERVDDANVCTIKDKKNSLPDLQTSKEENVDSGSKLKELKVEDLHSKVIDKEKKISKIDCNEKKAYKLPFKSHCALENHDINDPKWDVYKKLETDEQRYYIVRKHWKSLIVPDPNENLTLHNYRSRKTTKKEHTVEKHIRKGKRSHDGDNSNIELPAGKRMRLFDDMSFNSRAIEKTLAVLQHEYQEEIRTTRKSYDHLQKLDDAYREYFNQMQNARQEAEMVHKFYTGLPNQKVISQEEIEDEQWQIEKVYDLFKRYYNWSGKVFNPVIKR